VYRLDVRRLAADYSAAVRAALTKSQVLNVRNGEAVPADYIDTGELMADAIRLQDPTGTPAEYQAELIEADDRAHRSGYRLSRVLVACEFSATVRDAFRAAGHDAVSCDILPTENPAGPHMQRDVREVLGDGWHMMIAHPPCTYIAACQLWRCQRDPAREAKRQESLEFVRDLAAAPIDRACIENPKSCIGTERAAPGFDPQRVQPYQFGHDHSKETYLWRRNLPELSADPADYVEPRVIQYKGKAVTRGAHQSPCGADRMGPSPDRGHNRSRFFAGIAQAMADQWGGIKTQRPADVVQLALFA